MTTIHDARAPSAADGAYAVMHFDMYGAVHPAILGRTPPTQRDVAPRAALSDVAARALRRLRLVAGAATLAIAAAAAGEPAAAQVKLLNVSYDPTRELYREINEAFAAEWEAAGNPPVEIQTSHGGSSAQARAVIDGLEAQVVTLAMASDIDIIAERAGKVPADWQARLPHNSAPYTSTVVFLVREGNPKGIEDWDDLIREDVQVITPNPKTSGNGRWSYLGAWAWAEREFEGDRDQVIEFMTKLYANVPVLDSAARGSTTTFAQRGVGDVLIGWENEAYLALKELGEDQFDIVTPSLSMHAEPTVAVVDGNISSEEQAAAAQAYLDFLYTPEGQALAFKHFYRAWDTSAANPADVERFPEIDLVSIEDLGGWPKVQPEHFEEGGVFDQFYSAQ
jgi:sulfate transport system substrate-binding protein